MEHMWWASAKEGVARGARGGVQRDGARSQEMQLGGECDGESDDDVTDAQPRVQGCICGVQLGRRENRRDGEQRGSLAESYIMPP